MPRDRPRRGGGGGGGSRGDKPRFSGEPRSSKESWDPSWGDSWGDEWEEGWDESYDRGPNSKNDSRRSRRGGRGRKRRGGKGFDDENEDSGTDSEIEVEVDNTPTEREYLHIGDADAAFVLGKGGSTKQKIARVSGCKLDFQDDRKGKGGNGRSSIGRVAIVGTRKQRERAKKYIRLIMMQRGGPVRVDENLDDDGDLTMVDVPTSCVGFVTGSQGSFLRHCEKQWGTLMFFHEYAGPELPSGKGFETLGIFGTQRGRRGAELKIMAAIETKLPGYFTRGKSNFVSDEDYGTDLYSLTSDQMAFALGKEGSTRKKLAAASHAILEYIGSFAFIAGTRRERKLGREYLQWLVMQRQSDVVISDLATRDDVIALVIPPQLMGVASGFRGADLREIEMKTKTFCLIEGMKSDRVCVCASGSKRREKAAILVRELFSKYGGAGSGIDFVTIDITIPELAANTIDTDRILHFENSSGAKITLIKGAVQLSGATSEVANARKALSEYVSGLKLDLEVIIPDSIGLKVLVEKGKNGHSVLEDVSMQTRCKMKLNEKRTGVILNGSPNAVTAARRQIHRFLASFVTYTIHVEQDQLDFISAIGRKVFPTLPHFKMLAAAKVERDKKMLVLTGTMEVLTEASEKIFEFFQKKGFADPKVDVARTVNEGLDVSDSERFAILPSTGSDGRPQGMDRMDVSEDEAGFLLGKNGKTKQKIERVSGATIDIRERALKIDIWGTHNERVLAKKYLNFVRAQRLGPVRIDTNTCDDGDLTVINVPQECVGFVTGSGGVFLRSCEEEFRTLMFFTDFIGSTRGPRRSMETLAIFGLARGRRGSELKIMSAIETKIPGYFTRRDVLDQNTKNSFIKGADFGSVTVEMDDDETAFALGKDGATRKKLAVASGAITQYVGSTAIISGTAKERQRGESYLKWLLEQRTDDVIISDATTDGRDDILVVQSVDANGVQQNMNVFRSGSLRSVEAQTGTFCFLEGRNGNERLLICAAEKAAREKAEILARDMLKSGGPVLQKLDLNNCARSSSKNDIHTGDLENEDGELSLTITLPDDMAALLTSDKLSAIMQNNNVSIVLRRLKLKISGKNREDVEKAKADFQNYLQTSCFTDVYQLPKDIGIHVLIQTGPGGADPMVEQIENKCKVKCTIKRDINSVSFRSSQSAVSEAKKMLHTFMESFLICSVPFSAEELKFVDNLAAHYLKPMPHIASVDVDFESSSLIMRGTEDPLSEALDYLQDQFDTNNWQFPEEVNFHPYEIEALKDPSENSNKTPFHVDSDLFKVGSEDAAFILGRGGRTKAKLTRVSGASLDLRERSGTIEIWGPEDARKRARKYIEFVQAQRIGQVEIDESVDDDGDLTMVDVPPECIGFVTGTQGVFLKSCEEQFNTLMFFCTTPNAARDEKTGRRFEKLAIFGSDLRGRRGAELKVMAAVEAKISGYYTEDILQSGDYGLCTDAWGTEVFLMSQRHLSYALGRKGNTRKKIARAANCVVEYVGTVAFFAGTRYERFCAKQYCQWLCQQVDSGP
eukprot:gene996-450_t